MTIFEHLDTENINMEEKIHYSNSEVLKLIEYFNIELYIHRNRFQGEKDYGVPKERIIDDMYTMFNYNEE